MQRPEPIVGFLAPEGEYKLREEIHYDLPLNSYIGTSVSLVSLSNSNGPLGSLSTTNLDATSEVSTQLSKFGTSFTAKEKPQTPQKYVDVPIQPDSGNGGAYLL